MNAPPRPLEGRRVLIVEDDYFLVRVLVDHLRSQGAQIAGPVARLQPALQIARTEALDGAVLDVDLQGQCSLPVAAVLAEQDIPFVFVTGYDGTSLPEPYAKYPCCQKPVDPSVVVRKLFPAA